MAWLALAAPGVGCASATVTRSTGDGAEPRLATAGFAVVYSDAVGTWTELVPLDPAAPVVRAPGIWVLDEGVTPARLAVVAAAEEACGCPDGCAADASPFVAPDSLQSAYFLCDQPAFQSLVGGVIFGAYEDASDLCHTGLNLHEVADRSWDLTGAKTAWEPPRHAAIDALIAAHEAAARAWCYGSGGMGELAVGSDQVCVREGGDWTAASASESEDGSSCGFCADFSTAIPYLRDGALTVVRDDWQAVGQGPRRVDEVPVTAARCPSGADVCGDPARFAHVPEVARVLAAWRTPPDDDVAPVPTFEALAGTRAHFWIASDDAAALVVDGAAGTCRLWRPAPAGVAPAEAPMRTAACGAAAGEAVLGVRYHRDLGVFSARVCGATCDADRCREALPSSDCDLLEREKDTPCEYGPDAVSVPEQDGGPDAEPEAEPSRGTPGFGTDNGAETLQIYEDRARARAGTASELGNACFKLLKAPVGNDLDEARALCEEGLRRSPSPSTKGALLYNLGLIAEKQGRSSAALRLFRESLAVRPNAAVEAKLRELTRPR